MATKIEYRFIFDSNFFEEILKGDYTLQYELSYITSKAQGNKKKQNTISEKSRTKILENNKSISIETLRYFLNIIDGREKVIEIDEMEDEITRTIKYAVHLTYFSPNKVMIFTSRDNLEKYKINENCANVKSISVNAGEDAINLIKYWFKRCREERNASCD